MATRTLRLNYPASLLREPILQELIRNFEVTVNIRRAQISLEEGWLEIEAGGSEAELARSIVWLRQQGIDVLEAD